MSFYTNSGQAAVVFELGLRRESKPSEEGRERMSLLPLSRPIDRVWLRAGFEKRESIKSSEEGRERICVEFVILITPSHTGQDVDIRAGFIDLALDFF